MGVVVIFDNDDAAVEVEPGSDAACAVRVQNTGMVVDSVLLDVLGPAREWARVEPERLNLLPGAGGTARVTFSPPRAASMAAGELPFAVRAMSQEDPDGSRIEEGSVRITEFSDLTAELVPRTSTGSRSAGYRLVLENRGNRTEHLLLDASDPDAALRFDLRPGALRAEPGTATFVRLKTLPRRTFFKGPNKTLPFVVAARREHGIGEGDPISANGVMLEKQTLPKWLLPLLALLMLVCGLLIALWLLVLRPVVHSAASAEASAATSAQNAAAQAAKAANPGPATAVSVKVSSPNLVTGTGEQAVATGTYASGSTAQLSHGLSWASSNPAVATVSQTGEVTGVNPGAVTIIVSTAGGVTGTSGSATSSTSPITPDSPDTPGIQDAPGTPITASSTTILSDSDSLLGLGGSLLGPFDYSLAAGGLSSQSFGVPQLSAPLRAQPLAAATQPATSGSTTVNVLSPLAVSTALLPDGASDKIYSQPLNATGGTGTYTWSISAGSLPAGLALSPSSGSISGTPTTVGKSTFTVHVADAGPPNEYVTKSLTLDVDPSLAVGTSFLAPARIGSAYSQTLGAQGGTPAYSWSLAPGAGNLPAGLSLNALSGVISGTPTTAGQASFTVEATDSGSPQQSAIQQLSINVVKPLTLAAAALPDAVTGTSYAQSLAASGGSGAYTWSVTGGALPAGLSFSASSGLISGTPTTAGKASVTVTVTDGGAPAQTANQAVTVTVVAPLAVGTSSLADGVVGSAYSQTLSAVGGTAPVTWALSPGQGALPPGLNLVTGTGVISGTPTAAGRSTFTVRVTDSGKPQLAATQTLSVNIANTLVVTTLTLPGAVLNAQYSQTLGGTGGTQPYTWAVTVGVLPPGLSLNPGTGVISGQAANPAGATLPFSTAFTLSVTDAAAPVRTTVSQAFAIAVAAPLAITTSTLPNAKAGTAYTPPQLTETGGTAPELWTATGTLPPGLKLTSAGQFTGTPTTAGNYPFTVQVVDGSTPPQSATQSLSISVLNSLQIGSAPPVDGVAGQQYTQALVATGGTQPYTWSVAPATLPLGLNLDPATGVISGTPRAATGAAGPVQFTVEVADAGTPAQTTTATETITVYNRLAFILPPLPEAATATAYPPAVTDITPTVSGGDGSDTWSIATGGNLPTGLAVDGATGAISGAPSTGDPLGQDQFTLQVTDTANPPQTASVSETIDVIAGLTVTTPTPPTAVPGTAYDVDLIDGFTTGGTQPYSIPRVDTGAVADGLSLNQAGTLSGTPNDIPGTYEFTYSVCDSTSPAPLCDPVTLDLHVSSSLQVTWNSTDLGTVTVTSGFDSGTSYFTISGGGGGYTYSASGLDIEGTLADGGSVGLDTSTGDISGTIQNECDINGNVAESQSDTFTVTVTSADGGTSTSPELRINCQL